MSRFFRMLTMVLTALFVLSGSAFAASGQHEVTANKLYFRQEASSSGKAITTLSRGTVVTVLSTGDGWAKARWNGSVGYLSCEYLDKITAPSVSGSNTTRLSGTAWTEKTASLYRAADTGSEEIAELPGGTKLTLRGETYSFYYVKAGEKTGYILKTRITTEETGREKTAESSSSAVLRSGDSGSAVTALQERLCELKYIEKKYITGYYGDITARAVRKFQILAGLDADGVAGPATMKKLNSSSAPKKQAVVEKDWFDSDVSKSVYKRGGTAYIIDCETGIRIKIRRVGGSNHMDVEPAAASDTEKLLKIYGGSWSWDQRAVILIADGEYIAASINGMPHGAEISTDNNYEGQFCLHTTGSLTHGTEKVNGRHQQKIEEALEYLD